MRNIKIIIEYDGTKYNGWQSQKNGTGIQEILSNAIHQVTKETISLNGSGRTDAGVHALGQTANFKTNCQIPLEKIPEAINKYLPKDIRVKKACLMPQAFHARYSATGKKYMYIINNSCIASAINATHEYHIKYTLDIEKMKKATRYFIGTHDFKGFMATGSNIKDTTRTISNIEIKKDKDIISISFIGNGFLYNMVRIIVGTLIDVGNGKIKPEEIPDIIKSRDRTKAGKTVPAQGLFLVEVFFD